MTCQLRGIVVPADSTLTLAYFQYMTIAYFCFTQFAIGILYTATSFSPAATVENHYYGNCYMTGHPLPMTYQITEWPVICQVNEKNVIILSVTLLLIHHTLCYQTTLLLHYFLH